MKIDQEEDHLLDQLEEDSELPKDVLNTTTESKDIKLEESGHAI